jgi:cytochrome b561
MTGDAAKEDGMKGSRKRVLVATALWTLLLLVVATLIAGEAIASLYNRQQACFFNFPAVACPAGDDPAVARLTFAFFGVPALWLLGIVVGTVAVAMRNRRARVP